MAIRQLHQMAISVSFFDQFPVPLHDSRDLRDGHADSFCDLLIG
jgi:hypothetical protein